MRLFSFKLKFPALLKANVLIVVVVLLLVDPVAPALALVLVVRVPVPVAAPPSLALPCLASGTSFFLALLKNLIFCVVLPLLRLSFSSPLLSCLLSSFLSSSKSVDPVLTRKT